MRELRTLYRFVLVTVTTTSSLHCWSSPTAANSKNNAQSTRVKMTKLSSSIRARDELATTDITTGTPDNAKSESKKDVATMTKRILLIRHGTSLANEYMERNGNRWGESTFTDDASLRDSPLSTKGKGQAKQLHDMIQDYMEQEDGLDDDSYTMFDYTSHFKYFKDVDLAVVSPLMRTLQTFELAVQPHLPSERKIPVIAQPLATERVYSTSDLGSPTSSLRSRFPLIDFDSEFMTHGDTNPWWYTHDVDSEASYVEWRPHGKGQTYACPGEPEDHFRHRMVKLYDWLEKREERTILLVTHWAVIRWLTGEEYENCEAKVVRFDRMNRGDDLYLN